MKRVSMWVTLGLSLFLTRSTEAADLSNRGIIVNDPDFGMPPVVITSTTPTALRPVTMNPNVVAGHPRSRHYGLCHSQTLRGELIWVEYRDFCRLH